MLYVLQIFAFRYARGTREILAAAQRAAEISGYFWLPKMAHVFERHLDMSEGMSLLLPPPLLSRMKAMAPQASLCPVGALRGSIKGSHHPLSRF